MIILQNTLGFLRLVCLVLFQFTTLFQLYSDIWNSVFCNLIFEVLVLCQVDFKCTFEMHLLKPDIHCDTE